MWTFGLIQAKTQVLQINRKQENESLNLVLNLILYSKSTLCRNLFAARSFWRIWLFHTIFYCHKVFLIQMDVSSRAVSKFKHKNTKRILQTYSRHYTNITCSMNEFRQISILFFQPLPSILRH
jgi:hypothetical protein